MPRPLGDAVGERLELSEYYAEFRKNYARSREFWKLERGQVYAEPGDESWEAFDSGDWEESMRLLEQRRKELTAYYEKNAAAGMATWRIRIVSLPVTPYLHWALNVLKVRDEAGGLTRILLDNAVADLEEQRPLPDISTMDRDVMYQVAYDSNGVLEHALRYTDKALVSRCRDYIAELYDRGEPIADFFRREIAHLAPPPPAGPVIPRDYLERTGRPHPAGL